MIFFQVIRAARADRILRLLGALTNQLGLCVRFHKELFCGGEKDGRRGPFDKSRVFFLLLSSPRNIKKIHVRLLLYPIFSTGSGKVYIYTHTRSCIGKCTIKTTNQQQQQQHVYTLCGQSGLLLQDIL